MRLTRTRKFVLAAMLAAATLIGGTMVTASTASAARFRDLNSCGTVSPWSGSPRACVRTVQRAMKNCGYYRGRADGAFGPRTYRAVRAFQRNWFEKGEPRLRVDGVVGENTSYAMQRSCAI